MAKPKKRSAAAIAAAMMASGKAKSPAKVTAKPGPVASEPAPSSLADGVGLVERGELAAVLDVLLAAWRATPATELADLIVELGAQLETKVTWESVAKVPPAAAVSHLLATALDQGSKQGRVRAEAIVTWPLDPRVDRWVAQLFVDVPFTSTGARPLWTRLVPIASRILDVVASRTLAAAKKPAWIAEYVARIRRVIGERTDVALPGDGYEHVEEIRAALAQRTRASRPARADDAEQLLADVLARPDDDHARAVLGDVLLELGDPRGELIALQLEATRRPLTADEKRRARALVEDHRDALLGPLAPVITECTFARGFLSHAKLRGDGAKRTRQLIDATAGHPLWATVEHLEGPSDDQITPHEGMRSLRSLAATDMDLAWLAAHPRLERLTSMRYEPEWTPYLYQGGFAALRELELYAEPQQAALVLGSPLGERLDRLTVGVLVDTAWRADEAFAVLELAPRCTTRELVVAIARFYTTDWGARFRITRGERVTLGLACHGPGDHEAAIVEDLERGLGYLSRLEPAEVVVDRAPRTAALAKRLERAARAFTEG